MSSSSSGSGIASASASAYDFVGLPGTNIHSASASSTSTTIGQHHQNQGMAMLLVMLAVLCFIFAYCCWGAPFCRSICRRYCCCCCSRAFLPANHHHHHHHNQSSSTTLSESGGFLSSHTTAAMASRSQSRRAYHSASSAADPSAMLGTPTIILLPHGRMLVVDGTIFTQLQADSTGLDFVELGESVMRAQRNPGGNHRQLQSSQASIIEMDAETPSKDSMGSIGCFPPPTYESIYGKEETGDMPPSYSDILLHRLANLPFEIEDYSSCREDSKDESAMQQRSLENCSSSSSNTRIISNPFATHNTNRRPTATTSSTNERNYSSLPRNPSLQSNPLDAYFVDNELAVAAATRSQRRRSATALTSSSVATPTATARTRRTSCGESDSRTNDAAATAAVGRSENVVDEHFDNSWDQITRAPNDTATSEPEQYSSRANPIYNARSRRSTSTPENDTVQVHRYPEARYISDDEQRDGFSESDDAADEEANNFKVLADIRESRV